MKFKTTRFGEIEYPDEVVLTFPEGVLGFPEQTRYIMLEHDTEGSPFKWLQSLENADLAFIVVDPMNVESRYRYEIDADSARLIGTQNTEQCAVMAIVNVPGDQPIMMTANLKAPLIVNVENRMGRQIILGTNAFSIHTRVFPNMNRADEDAADQRAVSHG